jgi:hypothetical protein
MFAAIQPPLKLSLLSLTPKDAHAAELVELSLGMKKEERACSSFWEEEKGQEHATRFGKREN